MSLSSRESQRGARRGSKRISEHLCAIRTNVRGAAARHAAQLGRHIGKHVSRFGAAVCGLWPVKPALNLAQRLGCTDRAAELYIDGKRKPSAEAVHVVDTEMLSDLRGK